MEKSSAVKNGTIILFDKIASNLLLLGSFLVLILAWPILNFSLEIPKKIVLVGVVLISSLLWFLARLKDKRLLVVKSWIWPLSGLFLFFATLSSLFSGIPRVSFVGLGFESATLVSLLAFWFLFFLAAQYSQTKQKFLFVYLSIFAAFAVAFLFQVIRLSFGNFLPWPLFDYGSTNLIGKWNDFGVLAGFIVLTSILVLEFLPIRESKMTKNSLWSFLLAGLISLVLINSSVVWMILAGLLVLLCLYNFFFLNRGLDNQKRKMLVAIPVLIISLLFISFSQTKIDSNGNSEVGFIAKYNRQVSEKLNISSLEVRPSLKGTILITESSLKDSPIFGSGLNNFVAPWLENKPLGVNDGQFWNLEPTFGFGFIPSFFVMTGLTGGLVLVFLIFYLLFLGVRSLFSKSIDGIDKYFVLLATFGLFYFCSILIFTVPETSILTVSFLIFGLFLSQLAGVGQLKTKEINLIREGKSKFLTSFLIGFSFAVLLVLIWLWFASSLAVLSFEKSSKAIAIGNLEKAEKYLDLALRLNPQDAYYRSSAQLNVAKMNSLLAQKIPQEELLSKYSGVFEKAKQAVDNAVKSNSQNYLNYIVRGSLYENVIPLGVDGSYELAEKNYQEALKYNPHGPDMYLNLARLEIVNKDYTQAENYLEKSLAEKGNYLDAIFLQSQIYAEKGFLDSAIKRAEYAVSLAPDDGNVLFQLGYLKYRTADYRGAVKTLQAVVDRSPTYANARYFLGLSYYQLGSTNLAIKEFDELLKTNPDNQEIKKIISNLRAGRDPLAKEEEISKKKTAPVKP